MPVVQMTGSMQIGSVLFSQGDVVMLSDAESESVIAQHVGTLWQEKVVLPSHNKLMQQRRMKRTRHAQSSRLAASPLEDSSEFQ